MIFRPQLKYTTMELLLFPGSKFANKKETSRLGKGLRGILQTLLSKFDIYIRTAAINAWAVIYGEVIFLFTLLVVNLTIRF